MNLLIENKYLTIVFLLIFCGLPLLSQNERDSVKHLREVVVTQDAKRTQSRSTAPLQIIDNKKLASLNALQLSDAVKHFSGVTVKDYGGIGGLKTVSVRSLGANHTAISYDGIPVSDVQSGQIDIGRFSLENVDNVSLNIGQTDNIFQPARMFASASVLNIQSQKPRFQTNQKINGKIGLKAGSFGLFNPTVLLNTKISNKLSATFSGEWLGANGKYPYVLNYGIVGKDSSSVETRKNTDVKNLRLEGALYADFSEKSKGYVKAYFYNSERGLPGAIIFYNDKSFASQRLWDQNFFAQAQFEHRFSNRWAVQLNAKYNNSFSHFMDTAWLNQSQKIDNTFRQNELYTSLSTLYKQNDHLSFSASTDFLLNSMDANLYRFTFPTRVTSLSSIAGKYVNERITAIGSLLYTQTFESVEFGIPADNQQKFSPYMSFSVKPFETADFRLRAFYKNVFRLPTFNDLYYLRVGERKLKPEDANQFNLGITYSLSDISVFSNITFSADAYHNRIKNKIVARPSASLFEWSMMNYGIVHINGIDLNLETLIAVNQDVAIEMSGSYTFQKATDLTDKTSRTYGHQLPYTPFHSGSGRINAINPWVNVAYSMLWSGARYSNYQNYAENRMLPYFDHSISFNKSFEINRITARTGLEILNIFNQNYQVISGFPMPGRSFRLSLTINY